MIWVRLLDAATERELGVAEVGSLPQAGDLVAHWDLWSEGTNGGTYRLFEVHRVVHLTASMRSSDAPFRAVVVVYRYRPPPGGDAEAAALRKLLGP